MHSGLTTDRRPWPVPGDDISLVIGLGVVVVRACPRRRARPLDNDLFITRLM